MDLDDFTDLAGIFAIFLAVCAVIGTLNCLLFRMRWLVAFGSSIVTMILVGLIGVAVLALSNDKIMSAIFGNPAAAPTGRAPTTGTEYEKLAFQTPASLEEDQDSDVELVISANNSDEEMLATIAAMQPSGVSAESRKTQTLKIKGRHPVINAELIGPSFDIQPKGPQRIQAQPNRSKRTVLQWHWHIRALPSATLPPDGEDKLLSVILTGQLSDSAKAKTYQMDAPSAVAVTVYPRKEGLIKRASDVVAGMNSISGMLVGLVGAIVAALAYVRRRWRRENTEWVT